MSHISAHKKIYKLAHTSLIYYQPVPCSVSLIPSVTQRISNLVYISCL